MKLEKYALDVHKSFVEEHLIKVCFYMVSTKRFFMTQEDN